MEQEENLPKVGIFGGINSTCYDLLPLIRQAGFEIVAIWAECQDEADQAAHEFEIGFSSSNMDDILLHKDVGLLIILSPPMTHSQIAVKALGIGKHVYVSAPCSISTSQVLRMVQSAAYYPNLVACVGYGLRSLPAIVEMKKLISESYLGKTIVHCDVRIDCPNLIDSQYSWKCCQIMGGGILNQYGSHVIDLLKYLTNQKAARIHGIVKTIQKTTSKVRGIRQITADDVASLNFETENNESLVTVTLNAQSSRFSQELTLTGDEGQLILRNASLHGRKFLDNKSEEILHIHTPQCNKKSSKSSETELPEMYLTSYSKMFEELKLLFLQGPNEQDERLSSLEDALYAASVIEAARQSSIEKTWVKVLNEK